MPQDIYTDIGGELVKVTGAFEGDLVDGKKPGSLGVYTESVDGNQVMIKVENFSGPDLGTRAIYIATIPVSGVFGYP